MMNWRQYTLEKLKLTALTVVALVAVIGLPGCPKPVDLPEVSVYPPPYLPIDPARKTIIPTSQYMKIAVLNFVDQTGKAGDLVESLADVLSTELHQTRRFEIYDRGHLRHYDFTQVLDRCNCAGKGPGCDGKGSEGEGACSSSGESAGTDRFDARTSIAAESFDTLRSKTDALLLCAITTAADGKAVFDYRLVNSQSFTVLVAGVGSVNYRGTTDLLKVIRGGMVDVAQKIKKALPTPNTKSYGKVIVQDGVVLTVSLGQKDGIIPGLNIFVIGARGQGGRTSTVDEAYLAQAYVVSVYDNTSQVVVFHSENDYRVGDNVRFK